MIFGNVDHDIDVDVVMFYLRGLATHFVDEHFQGFSSELRSFLPVFFMI